MTSHIPVIKSFQSRFEQVDGRSYSLLCTADRPTRAVVLLHGFAGHPGRSWRALDSLIGQRQWWQRADVFFFGYESVFESIPETARKLESFLRSLLPTAPTDLLEGQSRKVETARGIETTYEELVLVAHSQGGLVVRQTILDVLWDVMRKHRDADEAEQLVAAAELRLFAPAINGARVSGLMGLVLGSAGPGTVARIALGLSPSFEEMQQGSSLIGGIRSDTAHFANQCGDVRSLRATIVWAGHDLVVLPRGQYPDDPKSVFIPGTNHKSVCKPTTELSAQLRFIEEGKVQ